jgi:hypothetical protein
VTDPPLATLLVAAGAAALVVGFLKTSIGGGIGLALTPALTLVLPAPVVLALLGILLTFADPIALRLYWRRWDGRQLRLLLPTTLVGVVLGVWALTLLSEFWLKKAIGGFALVFGLLQLAFLGRREGLFRDEPPRGVGAVIGLLTGVATTVAHSAGIVLGLYLTALRLSTTAIVATGNALVAFSNLLKLAGYWQIGLLTGRVVLAGLVAVPLLALGGWLGYRVNRRLPRRWFELAIIAVALAGALRLLGAA